MLLDMVFRVLIDILNFLTSWLPEVSELPFGIDDYLSAGMGYYHFVSEVFPPFATMLTAFLFVMAFKITMMVLRLVRIIR